ncbi:hypothetical protein QQS21_010956 [Conoideocrella luteorostrata]|uniref:Ubiquitin-like protease family profile domain-containing protein n=1 Tax=Conoideocrella luteorostrata TaxID=1105319 RepID=A0AAJ0FNZ5_9HYPO|nr:hypothetical protein QQS21_010956 [Conoideocrella luteorostrata]
MGVCETIVYMTFSGIAADFDPSPLARYYSEANSFPDYGTPSEKMPSKRMRQINGSTAGGLNTLTKLPRPATSPYSPSESPRTKRQKINETPSKDSVYSPYFAASAEPCVAKISPDFTPSGSQDDLHDFNSTTSTGKSKVRVKSPRSRRKSGSSSGTNQLLEVARRGEAITVEIPGRRDAVDTLDSPDILTEENGPPPTNARSDIVRQGPKRPRELQDTETSSLRLKRLRIQPPRESIDSEDELSRDQVGKRFTNSSTLTRPKRQASRGDIQPTRFLKPQSTPPNRILRQKIPDLRVRRAVSGKHMYDSKSEQCKLVLRQPDVGSQTICPSSTMDEKVCLDWMAIDFDNITKVQHAATKSPYVHIMRPRGASYEATLWLHLMDHEDVMNFTNAIKRSQSVYCSVSELAAKWDNAWETATKYQVANPSKASSSDFPNTRQNQLRSQLQPTDDDGAMIASIRREKLVERMKSATSEERRPNNPGREVEASTPRHPATRRTRQSSPTYVPQEQSLDLWTNQNPGWKERWHKSLVFPATGKNRATVDSDDIMRLDEGEFLNDNLISFYGRYLQFKLETEKPKLLNKVYFFSTFFFEKLRSTKGKINFEGVKSWTAKFDLFSFDYIIVPVNEHAHWYLAIICNTPNAVNGIPNENEGVATQGKDVSSAQIAAIERDMSDVTIRDDSGQIQPADVEIIGSPESSAKTLQYSSPTSKNETQHGSETNARSARFVDPKTPKIVTLDSLGSPHAATCKALKEYLIAEAKDKKRVDLAIIPNGMTAKKIPEQDNFCDCGVYILGYMEEFLKDPDETVRKLLQREPIGWDIRPSQLRNQVRDLLFELQQEQHVRLEKEMEEKRMLSLKRKAAAKAKLGIPDTGSSPTPNRKHVFVNLAIPPDVAAVANGAPFGTTAAAIEETIRSDRQTEDSVPQPSNRLSKDESVLIKAQKNNPATIARVPDEIIQHMPSSPHRIPSNFALKLSGTRKSDLKLKTATDKAGDETVMEALPGSTSEIEVQVTRATLTRVKRVSLEPTDVEEVMSISRQRTTRQQSKQLESSPLLVQPLRSSQSLSPTKPRAQYDGIERSVDLT